MTGMTIRNGGGGEWLRLVLLSTLLIAASALGHAARAAGGAACDTPGRWLAPANGETRAADRVVADLARRRVVLLGEVHDHAEDHLWQAQMLAALHADHPEMVVAFEMFPRRVQPLLDDWANGRLSEKDFLRKVGWKEIWGYDPAFYLPLFQIVRQNRLPMVAANVDRGLVRAVGRKGWAAVPPEDRRGIGDPAPPSDAYRRRLARVFLEKMRHGRDRKASIDEASAAEIDAILDEPGFGRFVDAQLTWDRAMAEAIRHALDAHPGALVVGVMGRGHVEYGFGVPRQLRDLGVDDVAVALPIALSECPDLATDVADVAFLVADPAPQPPEKRKPLLGVVIETAKTGVRIVRVTKDSVAERAGLAPDDVILGAAGSEVRRVEELVAVIHRQSPGTWLPLRVRRGGETLDIVAKFPPAFGVAE